MFKFWAIIILSLFCSTSALAQEDASNSDHKLINDLPHQIERMQLAAADKDLHMKGLSQPMEKESKEAFKERFFTSNKAHKYLGLGSLALAGMAALAPKEEGDSLHHELAQGAAILGGAAVATGFIFHYEDLQLKKGVKDPDNLHALLSTLGALGFAMAVNTAPEGSHSGFGGIGGVSMLAGIKINW